MTNTWLADMQQSLPGESTPLTAELLRAVSADPTRWFEPLRLACKLYEIDNGDRAAMFIAQCSHESSGFTRLRESMNYSAARLLAVFPKYFDADEAKDFANDPESIAERVYGGRMGNLPEGSGEGWKYIGRGLIGITGRENYEACGQSLGIDLITSPELLEQDEWAAISAGWFWSSNSCNAFADAGDLRGCTKKINGGYTGLPERMTLWEKAREALT